MACFRFFHAELSLMPVLLKKQSDQGLPYFDMAFVNSIPR